MRHGIVESARGRQRSGPYSAHKESPAWIAVVLELEGAVTSDYPKPVEQTLAADIEGATAVVSRIEVTAGRHQEAPECGRDAR